MKNFSQFRGIHGGANKFKQAPNAVIIQRYLGKSDTSDDVIVVPGGGGSYNPDDSNNSATPDIPNIPDDVGINITWDGSIGDRKAIYLHSPGDTPQYFVKVSDTPISDMQSLVSGTAKWYEGSQEGGIEITPDMIVELTESVSLMLIYGIPMFLNVLTPNSTATAEGITLTIEEEVVQLLLTDVSGKRQQG